MIMPKNRTESAEIKNLINSQTTIETLARKDNVLRSKFLRRIEIPNDARMKTRGRIRNKMKEVSLAYLVGWSGAGLKIKVVIELTVLLNGRSTFFDFSTDTPKGFSTDFKLTIPNQIAPAMKIIPKMARMFLVKKDSIFFCCSLFGMSSSRGRLEYL